MIYLRTGLPGASKTLNTIKEIIEEPANAHRQKFYNNIKLFMLDIEVLKSFQGWFYGHYYLQLDDVKKQKYDVLIKEIHSQQRLATLDDFPHLRGKYRLWDEEDIVHLFLKWVAKLYPKKSRQKLDNYLDITDHVTLYDLLQFNYHFEHFDDPDEWGELPNGSIILIDEIQDYWPSRDARKAVPKGVESLAKHRHSGRDLHMVTQHYKLCDTGVRRQIGIHVHFYNPLGGNNVNRYEKREIFDTDDANERKRTDSSTFMRDTKYYGVYWSADQHTHKLKVPKKFFALPILIGLVVTLIYSFFSFYGPDLDETKITELNMPTDNKVTVTKKTETPETKEIVTTLDNVTHPLQSQCVRFEYAGYHVVVLDNGLTDVEHFFNCVTGEKEEYEVRDGDQTWTYEQDIIQVFDSNFMRELGYQFRLKSNIPILNYKTFNYYMAPI
jgi:zona occludens toxin